tara:strand:- start:1077 stop:1643 length:567 start_codon:yes stop_codon:yes gene_type:complete
MKNKKIQTNLITLVILIFTLSSCKGGKLPGADARKVSADPRERVQKNIEEGRGFRLMGSINKKNTGEFDFASSNELWRASLDTLDFMPLALANYSGGLIVTDWYNDGDAINESVKISIRFLSNEIRSDALAIKVFYKNCSVQQSCRITDKSGALSNELVNKILTKAAIYEKQGDSKNKVKYINEALKD